MSRHVLSDRIRGEYLEMPGLHLTTRQASRLWGVDAAHCKAVLDELVEARFLVARHDGSYVRAGEGKILRPVAAKAELSPRDTRSKAS